jgi:hypothetical protein
MPKYLMDFVPSQSNWGLNPEPNISFLQAETILGTGTTDLGSPYHNHTHSICFDFHGTKIYIFHVQTLKDLYFILFL